MSSVELLSVHVPKTGGTAFRSVLETVYGAGCVHSVYPQATDAATAETEDERWLSDSLALCRRQHDVPRVIHGHFLLTYYADRFARAKKIAWLRNPVDRLVSFYYMWREMDPWPSASRLQLAVREGSLDLLDFARCPAVRDQVTSRFLGDPAGRGLAFIGIQERFDADLNRLGGLLGWPPLHAPRSNVNQSVEYAARSVTDELRSEIAGLNPADTELYRAVVDGRWQPDA